MISDRLQQYIDTHISPEPPLLAEIYRHTHLHRLYPRMCSGHHQGRILAMLTKMVSPEAILELGTFTGYATLCFAEATTAGTRIDTVEIDDEAEDYLREIFSRSGRGADIHLHIGDAIDVIPKLAAEGLTWDLVFIDANKRHYRQYLEMVTPLIPAGGYVFADNTLWSEKVIETPSKTVKDPQLEEIMGFNDEVASDTRWETVILPIRDGLTILRKK